MKKKLYFLFVFILIIACSPQVTEETDCCLAVNVTVPVPTETHTPTPIFTQTLNPTQFFNQQIADATQRPFLTKVAEFPRLCPEGGAYFSEYGPQISPNGLWLGEVCWAYDTKFNDLVLSFSNRETGVTWNLLYHDYIPDVDYADGAISVVKWSNDSKYAYFTTSLGGSGFECFVTGLDSGTGLFRIDVETGEVTAILPPNKTFRWYGFSISPTDRRLVYGIRSANLKILDIKTGKTIDVAHSKRLTESGGYVWSPDGREFIYSTLLYKDSYERDSYSIRLVNAETGVEKILLESPMACFSVMEWKDNILKIEKNYNYSILEFDLNTNTIISETLINP